MTDAYWSSVFPIREDKTFVVHLSPYLASPSPSPPSPSSPLYHKSSPFFPSPPRAQPRGSPPPPSPDPSAPATIGRGRAPLRVALREAGRAGAERGAAVRIVVPAVVSMRRVWRGRSRDFWVCSGIGEGLIVWYNNNDRTHIGRDIYRFQTILSKTAAQNRKSGSEPIDSHRRYTLSVPSSKINRNQQPTTNHNH